MKSPPWTLVENVPFQPFTKSDRLILLGFSGRFGGAFGLFLAVREKTFTLLVFFARIGLCHPHFFEHFML
jgi:hypothetical protein